MIQNVPGGALFETTAGSAGARSPDHGPQQRVEAATLDKTSAAHDALTRRRSDAPATAAAGGERTSDDSPRGRALDILV